MYISHLAPGSTTANVSGCAFDVALDLEVRADSSSSTNRASRSTPLVVAASSPSAVFSVEARASTLYVSPPGFDALTGQMMYTRASASDYDDFKQPGWDFKDILPLARKVRLDDRRAER